MPQLGDLALNTYPSSPVGSGNAVIAAVWSAVPLRLTSRPSAVSRIGRQLDRPRRLDLVARIEAYRRGEEPLSVPVALLAHYASGGEFGWLAEQTFLRPFPAGLRGHAVPAPVSAPVSAAAG